MKSFFAKLRLFLFLAFVDLQLPPKTSPTYLAELAIKAAQEDIVGAVCVVGSIVLFATGHVIVGLIVSLYTVAQCIDALRYGNALQSARTAHIREQANRQSECAGTPEP